MISHVFIENSYENESLLSKSHRPLIHAPQIDHLRGPLDREYLTQKNKASKQNFTVIPRNRMSALSSN